MALEFRDGTDLVIQADLPDVDPDRDIEVWISHDVLHIRARGRPGREEGAPLSDLRDGAFVRDIALPAGIGEAHVSARYGDGRLEVRAPIEGSTEHTAHRIPVLRGWQRPTVASSTSSAPGPRRAGSHAVGPEPRQD